MPETELRSQTITVSFILFTQASTVPQNPSQGANKKPGGFELQQQNRTGGSSWID